MNSLKPFFAASLFTLAPAGATTFVSPGDAANIPGVESFSYDHYYSIGNGEAASLVSNTDAYSWDHPNLASDNPALGNQTGWTHLTQWVALSVAEPIDLTIRIAATSGVLIADQNNPGEVIEAGDQLIPAFTLWSGFEALAENGRLGLQDPSRWPPLGQRWRRDRVGRSAPVCRPRRQRRRHLHHRAHPLPRRWGLHH